MLAPDGQAGTPYIAMLTARILSMQGISGANGWTAAYAH